MGHSTFPAAVEMGILEGKGSEQHLDSSDDEAEPVRAPLVTGMVNGSNLHVDEDQVWAEIQVNKVKGMDGWERKRASQQETGIELAMDWFINADVQPGIGCCHKVVNAFFKNNAAGERLSISGHCY